MHIWLIILLPLAFNFTSGGLATRIIGKGYIPAREGEFPFQVSLQKDFAHFCSGSIINDQFILTSYFCIRNKQISEIAVFAGSTDLYNGTMFNISRIVNHPNTTNKENISLLKTTSKILFSAYVQPVPLVDEWFELEYGTISGWGKTTNPGGPTRRLRYFHVSTILVNDCKSKHGSNGAYITENTICTQAAANGTGICNGDEGGPLVVKGRLAGVVAWSTGCGTNPDVHTRVSMFYGWIIRNAI